MSEHDEHSYFVLNEAYGDRRVESVDGSELPEEVAEATDVDGDLLYAVNYDPALAGPYAADGGISEVVVGGIDTGARKTDGALEKARVAALTGFNVRSVVEEFISDQLGEDLRPEDVTYSGREDQGQRVIGGKRVVEQ